MRNVLWTTALITALATTGCGKESFRSVTSKAAVAGPGSYMIPPKVDILMAIDDTGSMYPKISNVRAEVASFLGSLESKNWDFRFALTHLRASQPLDQILASRYDGNWNALGQWLSPFPGADPSLVDSVNPAYFRTMSNYTRFPNVSGPSGDEPGLQTIYDSLTIESPTRGFARPDALLVVIHIGNGQDLSQPGPQLCPRSGDGLMIPCTCASHGVCPSQTWSTGLTTWYSWFQAVRDPRQFRFYSWSNPSGGFASTRYRDVAGNLAGAGSYSGQVNFDINTQSLSQLMANVSSQLQAQKLQYRTKYLFIGQEPNPATIIVRKNGTVVPQNGTNGWTYIGYQAPPGIYAIDYPIPMNRRSGYAIQLNGSAKLVGEDTAEVEFKPAGFIN